MNLANVADVADEFEPINFCALETASIKENLDHRSYSFVYGGA
jgi:hypothetical protein